MFLTCGLLFRFNSPETTGPQVCSMFSLKNSSRILWLCLGLFLFAAILLPASWTSINLGGPPPLDAFSTEIARLDEQLDYGDSLSTEHQQSLQNHITLLQTRRLLRAGKMSSEETRQATKLLQHWLPQIESQTHEGSQATMRRARNDALADQFQRLDPQAIERELDLLDAQLLQTLNEKNRDSVD